VAVHVDVDRVVDLVVAGVVAVVVVPQHGEESAGEADGPCTDLELARGG